MKSTFLQFETRDFIRGALMAVLVPAFLIIQQSISAGAVVFDWRGIGYAALSGLLAYLTKQFFTDSTGAAVKTLEKQDVTIIEHGKDYRK